MKTVGHQNLEIGKLYDTVRKRSYPRIIHSEPECSSVTIIGYCYPEDTFVILELFEDNSRSRWTKILTSQGIVGWTSWIESVGNYKNFKQIT